MSSKEIEIGDVENIDDLPLPPIPPIPPTFPPPSPPPPPPPSVAPPLPRFSNLPPRSRVGGNVHPSCVCQKCYHWSTDPNWCLHFNFDEELLHAPDKNSSTQNPLVKPQRTEPYAKILKHKDAPNITEVGKLKSPRVLMHGPTLPEQFHRFRDCTFVQYVGEALTRANYEITRDMQSFSLMAFIRGMNMMLVGTQGCGKSMSYLPSLISLVLLHKDDPDKHKGPMSVILCPDSAACEEIYARIVTIFPEVSSMTNIHLMSSPISNITKCDVLITRSSLLMEALTARMFKLKRIRYLIMEEASIILTHERPQLFQIMRLCNEILETRVITKYPIQFVITSTKWTPHVNTLLHIMYDTPLVIFDSFLEAANYGGVHMRVKFILSQKKIDFIKSYIHLTYRYHRTVMFCSPAEILILSILMKNRAIDVITISEGQSKEKMAENEELWTQAKDGSYKVLLCTDVVFELFLNVTNADWVIHYSLSENWSRFGKRFRAFKDNLKSPLEPYCYKNDRVLFSTIMIDETCHLEIFRILDMMKSASLRVSDSLINFAELFSSETEKGKMEANAPFCNDLKMFGKCHNEFCDLRHIPSLVFDKFTVFRSVTKTVKFLLIEVYDVTRYVIQIIQTWNARGQVLSFNDARSEVTYPDIKKIKPSDHIRAGGYYCQLDGINVADGNFYMCKVVEFVEDENVLVRLTMNAAELVVKTAKIYDLPPNLMLCEVILSNLVPPLKDRTFSEKARAITRRELNRYSSKFTAFTGDVTFMLNRTIWLSNVVQSISTIACDMIPLNLTERFINLKLVEYDHEQLGNLYTMCEKANIAQNEPPTLPVPGTLHQGTPQEMFLTEGQITEVFISSAIDPYEIYVRLPKFDDLLTNLEKDASEYITDNDIAAVTETTLGCYYLAPDPRKTVFSRVKLIQIAKDDALVYYVDHGDEGLVKLHDLKPLPNRFRLRLPFQAIQCKLFGIAPCINVWDKHSVDVIYNFMFVSCTDYFRSIFVKSIDRDKGIGYTSYRYIVVMKDSLGQKKIINNMLVDCGLAVNYDIIEDFDLPPRDDDKLEDSDSLQALRVSSQSHDEIHVQVKEAKDLDDEGFYLNVSHVEEFLSMFRGPATTVLHFTEPNHVEDRHDDNVHNNSSSTAIVAPPTQTAPLTLTPQLYWTQFDDKIRLRVLVSNVKSYNVEIKDSYVVCNATSEDGRVYSVSFLPSGKLTLLRHALCGHEIKIYCQKGDYLEWTWLYEKSAHGRLRNVHYELFNNSKQVDVEREKYLHLGVTDSKANDSTDDLMYFVESDMSSDYDNDLHVDL